MPPAGRGTKYGSRTKEARWGCVTSTDRPLAPPAASTGSVIFQLVRSIGVAPDAVAASGVTVRVGAAIPDVPDAPDEPQPSAGQQDSPIMMKARMRTSLSFVAALAWILGLATPAAHAQQLPSSVPVSAPPAVILQGFRHQWQTWNNCGPATISMAVSYF